jgi:hypothetical protein
VRALGIGLSAALLTCAAWSRASSAMDIRCDEVWPAELEIEISLHGDRSDPLPGEIIDLEGQIINTSGGSAALPLFRLVGAERAFAVEEQSSSYPLVEFARYRLRALRPGRAALRLAVNFETFYGCIDLPTVVFRSATSPPYVITVRGTVEPVSATPTATPTPTPVWPIATATTRLSPARTSAASPGR